jgi:hypothetical protein
MFPAIIHAQGQILNGVVRSAAGPGTSLVIEVPGQPEQLNLRASDVVVMRNGQPALLADLQPGDQIVLTLGPDNAVQRVDATGDAAVATSEDVVVGTVTRNMGGRIVLMTTPSGEQEFSVPSSATIMRSGRDTQIGAIETHDSVVLALNTDGSVASIFAQPIGDQYVVEGTTTGNIRDGHLEVQIQEQTLQVPLPVGDGTRVTRDGRSARVDQLAANDHVLIRFNPLGRPVEVEARSTGKSGLLRSPWLLLLCLMPLLLLIPVALQRGIPIRIPFELPRLPRRRGQQIDTDDIDGMLG